MIALLLLVRPAAVTGQPLTAAGIDKIVRAQVDSGFSGVVLVAQGDSVMLRRGYGHAATLPSSERAFWIGSITKSFTAAAILMLRQQHLLSLGDSIERFFPDAPADKRRITIEQLLTHTAGFGATYSGGGIRDRSKAIGAILSQPLVYEPGRGYRYGDDDYELLAAAVEVVRGRSWEEVIQREVLDELGLRHTGFWCGSSRTARLPAHSLCSRDVTDWGHRGANGMSSTADDLMTWARALHRGTLPGLRAIEVPHRLVRREGTMEIAYGYGVRLYVRDGRVVEVMHAGSSDEGHSAVVRVLASGMIIVVLSDTGEHEGTTWSSYVATKLAPRE